jgi:hypothetical protein
VFLEAIPDLTPLLKPTTLGDVATYFFASVGGLLLGGELGKIIFDFVMVGEIVLTTLRRLCWRCRKRDADYHFGPREQKEN